MTFENIETTYTYDDDLYDDDLEGGDDSSGGTSNKSPVYQNLPIDGKISVMENTTHVIDIDATDDYDSEGNGLKYYIVGGADKDLYTIDQYTGKLSFINPPDFENPLDAHKNNIYDVIVRVVDSHGAYTDQSLWVHVTDKPDTNNVPDAVDDHFTVMEGGDINLKDQPEKGLLANDSDLDGDTLKVKAVNGESFTHEIIVEGSNGGQFTVLENGAFKFWASSDFDDLNTGETRDTYITYTIDDGNGGMDTATVKVTVTGKDDVSTNNAPDAVDDTNSTTAGKQVGTFVLENDSDPDGDPLKIKSFTQAANGEVRLNNNGTPEDQTDDKLVYFPNEGFTGTDSFTYTIADGKGGMDTATVTITVGNGGTGGGDNNPPVAVDDTNSTAPGQKIGTFVLENDSDPDGDPLKIKSFTQAANGEVRLNNNGTPEDQTDDKLVYIPNEGFTGTDSFTYAVADPSGAMDMATVTITVGDGGTGGGDNNPPVAVDDTNSTAPGQKVGTFVLENDSDPDGDPLKIKSFTQAANGEVRLNNNGTPEDQTDDKLVYIPDAGFTGTDSFTYAVADPSGAMDMATVTITVGDDTGSENKAPVAVDDYNTTTVDQRVGTFVLENDSDPDGDPLKIKSFTQAANGEVKLNNNGTPEDQTDDKLVYFPNEGFVGTDSFTYAVADPSGAMDMATVDIEVIDPNPAPEIKATLVGTDSIYEGDQGSYKIQLDSASNRERTFTIQIDDGTANRVDQYAANQDIIWGGFYDIRNSDGEVIKVVYDRVPNGTDPDTGDRPATGPGDASWDYTVYQDSSINVGDTITVTVAAGQTMSESFQVKAWKEQVTVDRDGPNSKDFLEGTENFSINVVGKDNTVFHQDSLQVEIIDKTDYGFVSPIAIDLNGDGIQTISIEAGVKFDIFNTGEKVSTGWLSGKDGFLAIDNDGDGLIENRDELFGGTGVGEAFEKLASYDSNNDGLINSLDDSFDQILVWQDANENAITDLGELRSLNAAGVSELSLDYQSNSIVDAQGNTLGETSTAVVNGETRDLVDVYFQQL